MPYRNSFTKDSLETGLSFDDVLLVPQYSPLLSRSDVSLETRVVGDIHIDAPIMSAPMDTVTSVDVASVFDAYGGTPVFDRYEGSESQSEKIRQVKENTNVPVGAALGVNEDVNDRVSSAIEAGVDYMVLTVAHADVEPVIQTVEEYNSKMWDVPLIVGNVVTEDAAFRLLEAGADGIKVGIGPGSFCTTRTVTGVGYPQLTAVSNCRKAVETYCRENNIHENKPTVIADGGIKQSGDAVKALAVGADSVMMGGFFTGTDEAPGEIIESGGTKYKIGRGMASKSANQERTDKSQEEIERIASEGEEMLIEYKGSLANHLEPFIFGVRNGISYVGADSIAELHDKAEFVAVTGATQSRNPAHKSQTGSEPPEPSDVLSAFSEDE